MEDEEDLFFVDRKESKRERKIATKTDRSQFKKTDFEKREAHRQEKQRRDLATGQFVRGIVLSIKPEEILVEADKKIYRCVLKGALKKEIRQSCNLVAVGDFVHFDPKNLSIGFIETRRSFLSKRSPIQAKKEQYIACNIDYVLITASCLLPALNPSLIDRYIIATRKGKMTPVIVINKIDLLGNETKEKALFEEAVSIYRALGFLITPVSAKTGEGIDDLKKIIMNHSSVFAGESGVGKSSLINILTGSNLTTREVTPKIQRGAHTTTRAELIPLAFGGYCIDTPGIQKFGIWDLQKEDLEAYFPEFNHLKLECHYPNCSHSHEPECAVRTAMEEGSISALRYNSYITLIKEIISESY